MYKRIFKNQYRNLVWLITFPNILISILGIYAPSKIILFLTKKDFITNLNFANNSIIENFIVRISLVGILFINLIVIRTALNPNAYREMIFRISLYFLSMSIVIFINIFQSFTLGLLIIGIIYFLYFVFFILIANQDIRIRE